MAEINLTPGSDEWHKWRRLATQTIPGKQSALYFLNAKIRGLESLVPMTYRAHLGMHLFAESATGLPEIDEARVKLILVSRGVGKSACITKGLPILRTIRDPEYATGIANEIAELAESFLAEIKNEFETNIILQTLFPEVWPPGFSPSVWKADRIITNRKKLNPTSPTIIAAGVGGTKTGIHQNEWVCDDLLSKNAAEALRRGNTGEIETTNQWITQLQPLLKNPKRDPLVFIGTKWWDGDSYEFLEKFFGHGEEKREFLWRLRLPPQRSTWMDGTTERTIDRPAEEQVLKLYRVGELAVFKVPARDENRRPIFPERLDDEALRLLEEEDPVFFAGQYLLEPTAGAAAYFQQDWLKYYDWDGGKIRIMNDDGRPEYIVPRDLNVFMSVDPAFSKKSTSARTSIPVTGLDGKRIFLLEDFAERVDSEDAIAAKSVEFYTRYKPQNISVETIVAQVAVANAIKRRFREMRLGEPPLTEIPGWGKQRKEMRIYGLEHYFKRGVFYIHRSHTNFLREYLSFPRGILRDILDALAFQVEDWEKVFNLAHFSGGALRTPEDVRAQDAAALARVRRAWGAKRRR
jgi:hypothetical protein